MQDDRLGTFDGALAPTLLTLLSVVPALGLPFAVATAGPVGTLAAIALGAGLAACTALALSAIISDAPAEPAPAHAPLTRSLGAELGGTLSIPLLLARPATAALAVIGAREIWCAAWPDHPPVVVDGLLLVLIALTAWRAPGGVRRAQAPLLALLALSLGLVLWRLRTATDQGVPPLGAAGWTGPWTALAVVFPALAGLLAGANIPGELARPRRALPRGTLWAVAVGGVVTLWMALGIARSVPAADLTRPALLVYQAPLPSIAATGLLLAALWVGISSLVGGSRLLAELAGGGLLDDRLDKALDRPEAALPVMVAATALLLVLARDVPTAAGLLSVLLLLCWGAVDVVVLALTVLGLPSFRPSWRVPRWVLAVGAVGSLTALLLMAPGLGLVGLGLLVARYGAMERQPRPADERSGLLLALAEWGAARVQRLGAVSPRAWRPHLLVPVPPPGLDPVERAFLARAVAPEGSLRLLGLVPPGGEAEGLESLRQELSAAELAVSATVVEAAHPADGVVTALQALQGTFLRPNLVYQRLGESRHDEDTVRVLAAARSAGMGVLLLAPSAVETSRRAVSVWVRPHAQGWDPREAFALGHLDLALLMAIRLHRQEKVRINLVTAVGEEADLPRAHAFLGGLATLGRLPPQATRAVALVGTLPEVVTRAPPADLHILGLPPAVDPELARRVQRTAGVSVLFVAGSGTASARA